MSHAHITSPPSLPSQDYELHEVAEALAAATAPRAAAAGARFLLPDSAFLDSGKARFLQTLLPALAASGSRVLIFSQFTQVLVVLGRALAVLGHRFVRIDGSTAAEERQPILDRFESDKVRARAVAAD